jgi:hypothetical protein
MAPSLPEVFIQLSSFSFVRLVFSTSSPCCRRCCVYYHFIYYYCPTDKAECSAAVRRLPFLCAFVTPNPEHMVTTTESSVTLLFLFLSSAQSPCWRWDGGALVNCWKERLFQVFLLQNMLQTSPRKRNPQKGWVVFLCEVAHRPLAAEASRLCTPSLPLSPSLPVRHADRVEVLMSVSTRGVCFCLWRRAKCFGLFLFFGIRFSVQERFGSSQGRASVASSPWFGTLKTTQRRCRRSGHHHQPKWGMILSTQRCVHT